MIKGVPGIKCIELKMQVGARIYEEMPRYLNVIVQYFSDKFDTLLRKYINILQHSTVHIYYSLYSILKSKTSRFKMDPLSRRRNQGLRQGHPWVNLFYFFYLRNCPKRQNMRKQEKGRNRQLVFVSPYLSDPLTR